MSPWDLLSGTFDQLGQTGLKVRQRRKAGGAALHQRHINR